MDDSPSPDLSFDRSPNVYGGEDGYDLWFGVPHKSGDATTHELQTLCQGSMLLGRVARAMEWGWTDLLGNVDHLSAPLDGFLMVEVGARAFASERFRRVLGESVAACGLDPHKVKLVDSENANVHVMAEGFSAL